MNKRSIKTAFLALAVAAILTPSSRADDTTTPATPANQSARQKFYGPITAVDTNAMTFTVGDQTFTITSESAITKNGKTATLGDAIVGEPARGSYTKSADGKLDVTKVRFGKKSGGKAGGKHKKSDASGTDASTPAAPPSNADTNSPPASPQQ
jgi:hypothetical protein